MDSSDEAGSDEREGGDPVVELVETVADAEGVDATEMRPPLGEVIDTDALKSVLQSSDVGTSVAFRYRDWEIEVDDSGEVTLREPDRA